MLSHELKIGAHVWDDLNTRWGYIHLIAGNEEDLTITSENSDCIITLGDSPDFDRSHGEWETNADKCFVYVPGKLFQGYPVCFDHFADEMENEGVYYSPHYNENCFGVELINVGAHED